MRASRPDLAVNLELTMFWLFSQKNPQHYSTSYVKNRYLRRNLQDIFFPHCLDLGYGQSSLGKDAAWHGKYRLCNLVIAEGH